MVRPRGNASNEDENNNDGMHPALAQALAAITASQTMMAQLMQQNTQAALAAQAAHAAHMANPPPPPPPMVNQQSHFDKFSRNRPSTYSGTDNPNDLVLWI